jgi:hypothetical protein
VEGKRHVETAMNRHSMGSAPDYTAAALIAGGVNLFCLLFAIWALWGLAPVLLVAVGIDAVIRRLGRHRGRG